MGFKHGENGRKPPVEVQTNRTHPTLAPSNPIPTYAAQFTGLPPQLLPTKEKKRGGPHPTGKATGGTKGDRSHPPEWTASRRLHLHLPPSPHHHPALVWDAQPPPPYTIDSRTQRRSGHGRAPHTAAEPPPPPSSSTSAATKFAHGPIEIKKKISHATASPSPRDAARRATALAAISAARAREREAPSSSSSAAGSGARRASWARACRGPARAWGSPTRRAPATPPGRGALGGGGAAGRDGGRHPPAPPPWRPSRKPRAPPRRRRPRQPGRPHPPQPPRATAGRTATRRSKVRGRDSVGWAASFPPIAFLPALVSGTDLFDLGQGDHGETRDCARVLAP
jgi:hypothetical protein